MDFWEAVRQLHDEKRRLDEAIAILEALVRGEDIKPEPRRGRKSMPPEERRAVAERMKRYWEQRRSQNSPP